MITFNPDEHLILRWLVFDSKLKIPQCQRNIILAKLDKLVAEDGQTLKIAKVKLLDSL